MNAYTFWKELDSLSEGLLGSYSTPRVDVAETKDHYELTAELPGFRKDDVTVQVKDGVLELTAAPAQAAETPAEAHWLVKERRAATFQRSFRLPRDVDGESIGAEFRDGLLVLTLPKRKSPSPDWSPSRRPDGLAGLPAGPPPRDSLGFMNVERVERLIRELLVELGEDPDRGRPAADPRTGRQELGIPDPGLPAGAGGRSESGPVSGVGPEHGDRAEHRNLLALRAPPAAVFRPLPGGLHPPRQGSGRQQDRPPGRRVRPPASNSGKTDRRIGPGRHGGHRRAGCRRGPSRPNTCA